MDFFVHRCNLGQWICHPDQVGAGDGTESTERILGLNRVHPRDDGKYAEHIIIRGMEAPRET